MLQPVSKMLKRSLFFEFKTSKKDFFLPFNQLIIN